MPSFFKTLFQKQNFLQKHRDELQKAATGQKAILSEIKNETTKREHWMWWAFPINLESYVKDNSLNKSELSSRTKEFALTTEEAKAYIQDKDLRAQLIKRLLEIVGKKNLGAFFEKVDIDKLNSSVKLFSTVATEDKQLMALLQKVNAHICQDTLKYTRKNVVQQNKMNGDIAGAINKNNKHSDESDATLLEAELKQLLSEGGKTTGKELKQITGKPLDKKKSMLNVLNVRDELLSKKKESDVSSLIHSYPSLDGAKHTRSTKSNLNIGTKFDNIFDRMKHNPKVKHLTVEQVIKIFTDAKKNDGYTNKIGVTFNPSVAEKEFSATFQKLCLNNGIASPKNNQVGLRTKRFVDEFKSQEKMREYIESKWNNKQEVQKS